MGKVIHGGAHPVLHLMRTARHFVIFRFSCNGLVEKNKLTKIESLEMGTVGGEELVKWEKMQDTTSREEKIHVLVRLRPLNEKENIVNEISDWECINDTTILYRNTLREGSIFPNAYTFDRVFRGDCSTKQVYEEGAKEIALSVVSGINSSIFAYGQTSSGKTYTMNGITEYTVVDIFDYIRRHEERAFVLKFSAIEIYNEAIRDLLSIENTPLRLRDDPERGTIVERGTEEILKDWKHLKELLSICEAQRRIGETTLNEKSSRSHQLIRLTIESSAREFLGKDNLTTLTASVNFIDLAGSERASQALSAGARLKEGCHINRSLLTLGTVIRKLSKGRHAHINYRDSKLTRILQPCLGGNARTAIICTLSPARSHVEQTRNTLLFACCAKEVTTRAQVNVVMSDKALVKHLQKELARLESELKNPGPVPSTTDHASLLRKKDLQIEKMEKEIRELTKQRDLAQSRVEDLLRMVGFDQGSSQVKNNTNREWLESDAWEDESLASESSSMVDSYGRNVGSRSFNNFNYRHGDGESHFKGIYSGLQDRNKTRGRSLADGTSSLESNGRKLVQSDSDDCKEVLCIDETEESSRDNNTESLALSPNENGVAMNLTNSGDDNVISQETMSTLLNGIREGRETQTGSPNSRLEHHLEESSSGSFKLKRSWSCRANLMTDSSSPGRAESTPPCDYENGFRSRPEGFGRKIAPLNFGSSYSRFDSQSSLGSAQRIKSATNEDITSLDTFVAGLKEMAKLEYEKQLVDGQRMETNDKLLNNGIEDGIVSTQEASETCLDWPREFEKQQRMICELWHICNVSLVHRTYFFLLIKGDRTDSIYVEVELRRLNFLKETFSHGTQIVEDSRGRPQTLVSSTRALRREREMLSRLMQKRFSEEERKILFQKWGIALNSKRRRLQLANCLWSSCKDMNHITDSAAIVAKLVRFFEQGQDLKGMFGLSFAPLQTNRRSYTWKNSMASLL